MLPIELTDDDLFPGTRAASYRGLGQLIVGHGDNLVEQSCEFVCVQMASGSVHCHCEWGTGPLDPFDLWIEEKPTQLFGSCTNGRPIRIGTLTVRTTPRCAQASERNVATFDVREVEVGSETLDRSWSAITFQLVNLDLGRARRRGTERVEPLQYEYANRIVRELMAVGAKGRQPIYAALRAARIIEA
ncbi:MAG: hypothetical protein H6Q33_3385 [Deltaproteobacteria bacterium]|nr:hypothetical protein [Deltaproteobacteria bacterium]